jgi:hypothetical protein
VVEASDNQGVRQKAVLIVAGTLAGGLLLAGLVVVAVAHGQASEAAMTACATLPADVRRGATTVTVESRLLPWKFTCVFRDMSGRVVAKIAAPYEVSWHNLIP